MPTRSPSISGWVATVSASTSTTSDIGTSTITNIEETIAGYYGISTDDISSEVAYGASGSFTLAIPDDVSEDTVIDAVISSVAESLDVHPSDIDVTVDMETGEVEFTVSSESYSEAAQNQFDLSSDSFEESISSSIEVAIPSTVFEDFVVSDDVEATIEFIVDADPEAQDLTAAGYQTEQLLNEFEVEVESNICEVFMFSIWHWKRVWKHYYPEPKASKFDSNFSPLTI